MIDFGNDLLNTRLAVKASTIYHYTSMATLPVLFENDADLYCTNTECLNDATEFYFGPNSFVDFLKEKHWIDEFNAKRLRNDLANKLKELWVNNWVMSFSEAEDDLSQWRGYVSGTSGGYAIGFNTRKVVEALEELTRQNKIKQFNNIPLLTKCVYLEQDKENIHLLYKRIFSQNKNAFESYLAVKDIDSNVRDIVIGAILFATLPIKHDAFRAEREARIIIPIADLDYSSVKILGGKPRIPVGIASLKEPLYSYIDKIYILPHGNTQSLLSQVKWLKNKCRATFEIVRSSIPYDPSR